MGPGLSVVNELATTVATRDLLTPEMKQPCISSDTRLLVRHLDGWLSLVA